MNVNLIILIITINIIFVIDSIQMLIRINSAGYDSPILGAHIGSVLLLANRGATAIMLMIVGYLVDIGIESAMLVGAYSIASIGIILFHVLLLRKGLINSITKIFFLLLYKKDIKLKNDEPEFYRQGVIKLVWPSLIFISIISYFGLLLPSVLASAYSEYRATLMQSGFLINSFATFVYVISIEKKIAVIITRGLNSEINFIYKSYLISRIVSYLTSFLISCLLIGLLV